MKPLQAIRAFMFGGLVFLPLLVVNAMQMISILWRYTSAKWFRRYNSFWASTYWSYIVWLASSFGNLRISFSGDELPKAENAVIISNHQSAVDIVVQLAMGRRYRRLGRMKFFAKDVLKYVPGPGWGMVFLDCIFMKRDWTRDRDNVLRQLRRYKEAGAPIWINIYPEGTRLKPSKLKAAQEFAAAQGWPVPQRVLIPRMKGFLATVEGLEGHIGAVYDLTIVYKDGQAPTLWELLSCQGFDVKVDIRRYPIDQLPASPEGRSQWLMQLYREKDQKITDIIQTF